MGKPWQLPLRRYWAIFCLFYIRMTMTLLNILRDVALLIKQFRASRFYRLKFLVTVLCTAKVLSSLGLGSFCELWFEGREANDLTLIDITSIFTVWRCFGQHILRHITRQGIHWIIRERNEIYRCMCLSSSETKYLDNSHSTIPFFNVRQLYSKSSYYKIISSREAQSCKRSPNKLPL